jgi:hypothetical protein
MQAVLIIIFVLLTALVLFFRAKPAVVSGGASITKPTALLVNCGEFYYWPLRDRLAANFTFDKEAIAGIFTQSPARPIKHKYADFIRLDYHYFTNTLDYRFLAVKSAFINRFDRISKRAFVVKHRVHKFLADKHFYPTPVALASPPLDRIWIARPSSVSYTPGITTWSGADIKIIYDADSLQRARELYSKRAHVVKTLTPSNEYAVTVTEYITNPLLHFGKKVSLHMYILSGSGETVEPFCNINKDIGFYRIADSPYVADDYDNMSVHYPRKFARSLFYPQGIPENKLDHIRGQLCDMEAALCPLAQTLSWPEAARGAYEIFTLELLVDQNYKVWLTGISPHVAHPYADYDNPLKEKFAVEFSRWEYESAIAPLARGLLDNPERF